MIGETTMELFTFMGKNLSGPIDIFILFQRITIEILGKMAFGYQFGVSLIFFFFCQFFDDQEIILISLLEFEIT